MLDIEKGIADVNHANDVSMGLESLQAVMESIGELDISDISMIQVIGDIAGASSGGLSGHLFTPAMEATDDGGSSAGDKAKNISAKISEMIKMIMAKIKQFVEWLVARGQADFKVLQTAGARVANVVGQQVDKNKYDALKQLLQSDMKLIESLPEFLQLVNALATTRTIFANMKIGEFNQDQPLDDRYVRLLNAAHTQLGNFGTKYNHAKFLTGISYQVLNETVDATNVSMASYGFSHNVVSVHRADRVTPAEAGQTQVRIGHDLVSAIEDVYNGFVKFQNPADANSIGGQIRALGKLTQTMGNAFDTRIAEAERQGNNVQAVHAVMGRVLSGIRSDLGALTTMSYAIAAEQHVLAARYNEISKLLRDEGEGLSKPAAVAA